MKGTHPKTRATESCSLQGEIVAGWGQEKCRHTELLAGEWVQQHIREHVKYLEKKEGITARGHFCSGAGAAAREEHLL